MNPFDPIRNHFKDITYWPPATTKNAAGETVASTQTEIKGAWQKSTEYVDEVDGVRKKATDIVYTDVEVEEEGYLYEGISTASNPKDVTGVVRILRAKRLNDIHQNYGLCKAWAAL